jgi:hypothetical protein
LSGLFCLLFSSSRSALLGLFVNFALMAFWFATRSYSVLRAFRFTLAALALLLVSVPVLLSVLPLRIITRIGSFFGVFVAGIGVDATASARTEMWIELLDVLSQRYPLGTGVPPAYALSSAVDGFYIAVFLQGGAPYLISFIMLLTGAIVAAVRLFESPRLTYQMTAILLIAATGIIIGASVAVSPILKPAILVPFWFTLGVAVAILVPQPSASTCATGQMIDSVD